MAVFPFFIALLSVLVIVGVIVHSANDREKLVSRWSALAEARGMQFRPGGWFAHPEVSGKVDSRDVEIGIELRSQGKSSIPYTTVQATTLRPMPVGLEVTREGLGDAIGKMLGGQDIQISDARLDPKLRFRAQDAPAAAAMFSDPALRRDLSSLLTPCSYSRLHGQHVILEAQGRSKTPVESMLEEAVKLARSLDNARLSPWQAAASRHNLELRDQVSRITLSGTHRGRHVVINADLRGNATFIDVPVTGLPAGLSITRGKDPAGVRLGDPVLDGMITVKGRNPDALRALLRDDDLRGELLAVVHAWPGSAVVREGVRLCLPGAAAEGLEARLEEATALASRLSARLEAAEKQRQRQRQRQET